MIKLSMQKIWRLLKSAHTPVNDENGQILIIILLVLVVGVSIVLSLSARSLTDIRTTTSTEQSNRAYFAAEAGIERALQQIKDGGVSGTTQIAGNNSPLGNQAQYNGQIEITGGSTNAFAYDALKDQTIQVNLKPNINMTTYSDANFGLASGRLSVNWHVGGNPTPSAALEISILRVNSSGDYQMDRIACDKDAATRGNGFNCTGPAGLAVTNGGNNCSANPVPVSNKGSSVTNIFYCNSISFNAVGAGSYKSVLMRIRPLYQGDQIAVRYFTSGEYPSGTAGSLPQQGYKITSTGTGSDGASRKLEVYRSFPTLPTVFDFVLYNGSSNALTKP